MTVITNRNEACPHIKAIISKIKRTSTRFCGSFDIDCQECALTLSEVYVAHDEDDVFTLVDE